MKCSISLEHWEWPIFKAEPSGFDYVQISMREPSCAVEVCVVISLKDARALGERLIALSECLKQASSP